MTKTCLDRQDARNCKSPTPMKITIADFFTGFFSALRLRFERENPTFECGEHFNESLQAAFEKFVDTAAQNDLQPNFLIYLDPLHGDSSVIEEGLVGGIRRDLVSLDNPNFEKVRLVVTPAEAQENLESAPGGPPLYQKLVEDFLHQFNPHQAVR